MKWMTASALLILTAGCKPAQRGAVCPDPQAVAPASIGAKAVTALTPVLAGPDRENEISEAIHRFRATDPTISDDTVIDIMIAADCPNASPGADAATMKARAGRLRAEVAGILARE